MKLHHIGKVVGDIAEARTYYKETFGFEALGEPVIDPIQKVEVLLINSGFGPEVTIELVRPISEDSPVYRFLKKTGGGIHHLSYEVEDIHAAIAQLEEKGAKALGKVVPSTGHNNYPSVWLYTRSRELIELIERKAQA
ncbi:MAG: methylmalonyl-CoA epimerase [bacterium]|nr:methylmalonyl-CoA epimerase [bacterium]